jgi:small-conductance mechanosensitive channel
VPPGAGLLASAGVAGLVAGVAARPTATNVVAGLQIALSQPIRVDDVVVVEDEWGRVEEIALTYVVIRVWDLRRLVLPISYFITNPFENWTRATADILGWVYLQVDYSAPVDDIRRHLYEVLCSSPNWDGNVWNLQVTDAGPSTIQLRALMSARDSSTSWDLQCEVREKLVAYLQERHPGALPRLRTEPVGRHELSTTRSGFPVD